jgi:hypothetical protein
VLKAGGSSLADVAKVNIFLADMKDFAAVNEVYVEAFPEPRPVCCYFPSFLFVAPELGRNGILTLFTTWFWLTHLMLSGPNVCGCQDVATGVGCRN